MEFSLRTRDPIEVRDVTGAVADALPPDADGVATVFVPHTTAGVVVQEAESGLLADLRSLLADVVPADGDYRHDAVDDNAAAHLRATVAGEHVAVPVSAGALELGTWQSVLFVECDGPRERRVRVRA